MSLHINAFTLGMSHERLQNFLEISLFIAVNIWIIETLFSALNLDFRIFPPPLHLPLFDSLTLKSIGAFLIVLGFAAFILAIVALGDSWRLGIDKATPASLVTHGIYAISRNPIYGFFNLYFFGVFLINGTLIHLIFALFVALNLHYQILGEEKFLEKTHGQSYRDYCAITNRYFTWRQMKHSPTTDKT